MHATGRLCHATTWEPAPPCVDEHYPAKRQPSYPGTELPSAASQAMTLLSRSPCDNAKASAVPTTSTVPPMPAEEQGIDCLIPCGPGACSTLLPQGFFLGSVDQSDSEASSIDDQNCQGYAVLCVSYPIELLQDSSRAVSEDL